MAKIASFSRGSSTREEPPQPTQTEQAFGLLGEDNAISYEDYLGKQDKDLEKQTENILEEYLSKLEPDDAEYQREQLTQLPSNSMLDIIYDEDRDSVIKYTDPESQPAKEREFVLKNVPRAIAPYVRVVAKGGGFVVVKPLEEVDDVVANSIAEAVEKQRVENISQGAELKPRELNMQEKHVAGLAGIMKKVGIAKDDFQARNLASQVIGDPTGGQVTKGLFGTGFAPTDFVALGAAYAFDQSYDEIQALNKREDASGYDYIAPIAIAGLSALEAIPLTKGLAKAGVRAIKGQRIRQRDLYELDEKLKNLDTTDEIRVAVDAETVSGEGKKRADKARAKYDLGKAREATDEVEQAKKELARKEAADDEGMGIAEELVLEYESELQKLNIIGEDEKITRKVFGRTVVDYTKVKNVGKSRLDDLALPDDTVSELGFGADGYRMAILNPDILDKLVSVVKEIKKTKPDFIKSGSKKGVMRQLFEASIDKDKKLLQDPDFLAALDKYGLGLEDFILQANASASYAGKVLNRFSQMGKAARKTDAQKAEEEAMAIMNKAGSFGKGVRRVVNIARGALVGTVATAMRNLEGFLVRAPLDGLTDVFTNAIVLAATKGKKPIPPNTFKDSYASGMRTFGEMFRDRAGIKEYSDFILKRDEFNKEYGLMYEQINEIRMGLGRGEATTKLGQGADFILSKMEDYVHYANTPNRMQEFFTRRTAFLSGLETLVKREYGIDLMGAINAGKINDLIRSNPAIIGEGKRNFNELVADATQGALDKTYGSGPRNDFLKSLLTVFNKTPGGLGGFVIPFPRFMLKAGEYMYETTLGLPTAVTRRIFGMGEAGGKFVTAQGKATYNAEMAARGMAGWTGIGGMYMAANAGLITKDNKIKLPNGKKLDVTYQFPLAQFVYLGNFLETAFNPNKDLAEFWDAREFRDLFAGVNFRTQTGLGQLMDDVFLMLNKEAKAGTEEKLAETGGSFIADRLLWIAQPYQQVIDLERGLGLRDTVVRDYSTDPDMTFGGSFKKGFQERFQTRGYTTQEGGLTAYIGEQIGQGMTEEDRVAPIKQQPTKPGGRDRGQLGSLFKFSLGLNIMDKYTEEQDFLKKYGFNDWDFASRTGVGTVDNAINETISGVLPSIVGSLIRDEERLIERGETRSIIKKKMKSNIKRLTSDIKSKILRDGLKVRGAEDPAYVKALFKLRNINAETQAYIRELYFESTGKYPDLTKTEDIEAMVKIAEKGRMDKPLIK